MHDFVDQASPVRAGEQLDASQLEIFLKDAIPGLEGPLSIEQFPSGFSNLTYLLRAGERALVLRRPPFGSKVKAAHDVGREYTVLSALHPVYPPAPKPLVLCESAALLGAPFYIMERIRGVILRGKKPPGFVCVPETVRRCCGAFVENLAQLHGLDYEAIGLGKLHREGSFVERNVLGWIDRYYGSQTDDIPAIDQTAAWLKGHYPADVGTVLIHNDYKFDNLVLDPQDLTRITGVLDWEMCTIGDPLMDLGVVLSYWLESKDTPMGLVPCFLTLEPGAMTRLEVAEHYALVSGREVSNILFYYVFGLLKLAVIVQQIYYRYKQGLTQDQRFAPLIFVVGALGLKAAAAIETGEI